MCKETDASDKEKKAKNAKPAPAKGDAKKETPPAAEPKKTEPAEQKGDAAPENGAQPAAPTPPPASPPAPAGEPESYTSTGSDSGYYSSSDSTE